ncbi:MAG: 2Fe-2S iron-sulfur cluster-binding protein [bacterium]
MPTLTIDNRAVPFELGETILQVAYRAGIAIPTLCHLQGIEPPTSCYVCVVKIQGKSNMAPSCATLAEDGMILESSSDEVRHYRRRALELLLSEHAGDCEGPCRRICPADLDIPVMAKHIVAGDLDAAVRTVRERLALPGVLGHICPAPCQKGCVRAHADGAVTIRELHKGVAGAAAQNSAAPGPCPAPSSGKRVTIIGAGPAGLSSAYYVSLLGHACTIVDEREEPGGMLRYGIDRAVLPLNILDQEIDVIRLLGVEFRMGSRVSDQCALDELIQRFDAIIFATGAPTSDQPWPFTIKASPKGIAVDTHTFVSSSSNIFACGGAIAICKMAVRAVGQGRLTAQSVHHFLTHSNVGVTWSPRFDSHLGKLAPEELQQLVSTDLTHRLKGLEGTVTPVPRLGCNPTLQSSLVSAAARCMQCDCGKKLTCSLRAYAQEYEAHRDQYRTGSRKHVVRKRYASGLVHEPGKCIDCGCCIGITAAEHVQPGLAFGNRGFDVTVKAPFRADMDTAMGSSLERCIAACPVGSLWR